MIRVCHMTSAHNSDDVRIFEKECVSLAKSGYKVYLVAQGDSYDKNGVQVLGIGKIPKSRFKRITEVTKVIYQSALSIDADIYHFHDPELLPYALKLKKIGKKVIYDSHENYTMQIKEKGYISKCARNFIAKLFNIYETYVARRVDAVIVPCTFEGKNIFEGRSKQTVFITNAPIISDFFHENNNEQIQTNYICYAGQLTYNRGITQMIKAASKANVSLVLAGEFNSDAYLQFTKSMPEFNNIDYRGYVNKDELLKIYSQAKVGMSTLLKVGQYDKIDTFPIKVYEYMSMGLPVIITDYSYARNVLKEYEFGICVEPEDVDSIAKAITYLIDNHDIANKMGENGKRAILEKYNWGVEEKKLLELYSILQ